MSDPSTFEERHDAIDALQSSLLLPAPGTPLPRDEHGTIRTSAEFGESMMVRITYNTDNEGRWVDDDDYSNQTFHGPLTMAEAQEWMAAYPDDTDVKDMDAVTLNNVRPA